MAQLVIRNLGEDIKQHLKQQALAHGLSMEAEARLILTNALKNKQPASLDLGSRMVARFVNAGLDEPLPELHGEQILPVDFK